MSVSVVKPPSVVSRVGLGTVGEGGSSRGNLEYSLGIVMGNDCLGVPEVFCIYLDLSYDITVFQQITSCNKVL